jgi:hypothetical protein
VAWVTTWLTSRGFGESGCRREKASSRTSCDARSAPVSALRACRCVLSSSGVRRTMASRLPITIDSRLLKSCAMPPVRKQQFDLFEDLVGMLDSDVERTCDPLVRRPRHEAVVLQAGDGQHEHGSDDVAAMMSLKLVVAEGGDEPLWLLVEGRTQDRTDKSV